MKIAYTDKLPSEAVLKVIGTANKILDAYQAEGFTLTIRQLFYRFVATGLLENKPSTYSLIGRAISQGRMAGLVDWNAIEDRTRALMGQTYKKDALDAATSAHEEFKMDKWADQEWRPEGWVEKDAQEGIIAPVCDDLGIDYFSCRGYNSMSECWRAAQRFAGYIRKGQRPIVFHLGDHDPSGLHMSKDNSERLNIFAGTPITFVRLALNMDQIERYKPPPNTAKATDPRWPWYKHTTGLDVSWELDALEPKAVHALIRAAVLKLRQDSKWANALAAEAEQKQILADLVEEITPKEGTD